jgi:pimeloyl-[acyl-carrier protein] methyl ester esterase
MVAVTTQPSTLYVQRLGEGPPLLMLHGWAMHGGVWSGYLEGLAKWYTVYALDLPGHGYSTPIDDVTGLDDFVDKVNEAVEQVIHEPFYLIGWSMGGLLALRMLLDDPQRIRKLQLIAANPCFVQRKDWPSGVNPHVLKTFAAQLSEHYEQTLQRFLALQLQGDPEAREHLRALRQSLFERGVPSARALQAGLQVLLSTDLRTQLDGVSRPLQLILGERDTLVPVRLADSIGSYAPDTDIRIINGAGHAPFLSHLPELLEQSRQFLQ